MATILDGPKRCNDEDSGRDENPAEGRPSKPTGRTDWLQGGSTAVLRERKGHDFAALCAAGEVMQDKLALRFRQRALGEGCQDVRVRVRGGNSCLQPLSHD